jgi:hypothetical protein
VLGVRLDGASHALRVWAQRSQVSDMLGFGEGGQASGPQSGRDGDGGLFAIYPVGPIVEFSQSPLRVCFFWFLGECRCLKEEIFWSLRGVGVVVLAGGRMPCSGRGVTCRSDLCRSRSTLVVGCSRCVRFTFLHLVAPLR